MTIPFSLFAASPGVYYAFENSDNVGKGIVVLLLMLSSLFSWLRQDLTMTFADLSDNITDAVIVDHR